MRAADGVRARLVDAQGDLGQVRRDDHARSDAEVARDRARGVRADERRAVLRAALLRGAGEGAAALGVRAGRGARGRGEDGECHGHPGRPADELEHPAWHIQARSAPRARVTARAASMHRFEPAQPSAKLQASPLQHSCHHLERAGLGQRLVEVAALGRLHARRAARLARALADEPVRVLDEHVEVAKALQRDPDAARVPVVDEDRRAARSAGGSSSTGRRCPSGRTWPAAAARRSACARRRAARRAGPRAGTPRGGPRPSSYHSACVVNECGGRSTPLRSMTSWSGRRLRW